MAKARSITSSPPAPTSASSLASSLRAAVKLCRATGTHQREMPFENVARLIESVTAKSHKRMAPSTFVAPAVATDERNVRCRRLTVSSQIGLMNSKREPRDPTYAGRWNGSGRESTRLAIPRRGELAAAYCQEARDLAAESHDRRANIERSFRCRGQEMLSAMGPGRKMDNSKFSTRCFFEPRHSLSTTAQRELVPAQSAKGLIDPLTHA